MKSKTDTCIWDFITFDVLLSTKNWGLKIGSLNFSETNKKSGKKPDMSWGEKQNSQIWNLGCLQKQ